MKKIFVSALAVLNLLFASAQEAQMNVSFTPVGGETVTTTAETKPVEVQTETQAQTDTDQNSTAEQPATTQAAPVQQPAIQQSVAVQPAAQSATQTSSVSSSTSSSSSDDYDSEFFSSNNDSEVESGDIRNVIGIRASFCTSKATSYGVYSAHQLGFSAGAVDQIWFGERNVFVETGVFYSLKGYKLLEFEPSSTKIHYLQFPTLICYRQGRESLSLTYKAGGYLACGVKGTLNTYISESPAAIDLFKMEHEYDLFKEGAIGRFDAGARFGVDFVVRRVLVCFTYDLGLYKIDKKDLVYGEDELMLGYKKLKNRSFLIGLGVNF